MIEEAYVSFEVAKLPKRKDLMNLFNTSTSLIAKNYTEELCLLIPRLVISFIMPQPIKWQWVG